MQRVRVYTRKIQGVDALNYVYAPNSEISFHFHLECEVGEPWRAQAQRLAQALAQKRGCVIRQVELDAEPWYVDALVKELS